MPVYRVQIRGQATKRMVLADSAAKARVHVVDCEAITATEMAALLAEGVTLEHTVMVEGLGAATTEEPKLETMEPVPEQDSKSKAKEPKAASEAEKEAA